MGARGGEAGGRPVRRTGRRTEPRPRAGRMEGGWGQPGTHFHLHPLVTPRPPARGVPGRDRVVVARPAEGRARQDQGTRAWLAGGPGRRPRAGIPSTVASPPAPRRAGRPLHLALRPVTGTWGARPARGGSRSGRKWGPSALKRRRWSCKLHLNSEEGGLGSLVKF